MHSVLYIDNLRLLLGFQVHPKFISSHLIFISVLSYLTFLYVCLKQGGLAIIQSTALHSLVDYINVHLQLLTAATSVSRPSSLENRDVFGSQRSKNADGSNPLLKSTARSVSLPPWGVGNNTTKVRRMLSAPRRLQAATEIKHESTLKKGFDGVVSALLNGLSIVLVQRGSSSAGLCTSHNADGAHLDIE